MCNHTNYSEETPTERAVREAIEHVGNRSFDVAVQRADLLFTGQTRISVGPLGQETQQ